VLAVIRFYDVIVFIHVAAVVVGLGLVFSYPMLWRAAVKSFPRSVPYLLSTQSLIGKAVIGPLTALVLLSGLYLVGEGPFDFGTTFVAVGLPIVIYLFLAGPVFFSPTESKLGELAERDIAAAGEGEVAFSDEFNALFRRLMIVASLSQFLILVAVFFMVVKP
jgi:hypothetical protein